MTTSKKSAPKQQEPSSEQTPEAQEEQGRPMAVPEPTIEERMEALEIRLKVVEEFTTKHNRYHFRA